MGESLAFYFFSGLSVASVILLIFQKNPVASALFLVLSFFGLAGLYVLLSATFVAALQILVYAGAIMVLFVFVIMLLRLKDEDLKEVKLTGTRITALILGTLFLGFLGVKVFKSPLLESPVLAENFGQAKEVGKILFTDYLIPFELISITLIVAIIGVIMLAKKEN